MTSTSQKHAQGWVSAKFELPEREVMDFCGQVGKGIAVAEVVPCEQFGPKDWLYVVQPDGEPDVVIGELYNPELDGALIGRVVRTERLL